MSGQLARSVVHAALLAAAAAAVALGLAACGDDSTSPGSSTAAAGVDAKVAALVPAAAKAKGVLTVVAEATYAPNEFIGPDGRTVVGMSADLAKALAATMGLQAKVVNSPFDSIIPGLTSKKYDLGISSITDTKEREQTVDFVTYFTAGTSFLVNSDGPAINTIADLCGHKVAVGKGTTQADDAAAQAKKCTSKPAEVLIFPDQNGANLALSSGRADVGMADSPVAAYQVKQSGGAFKVVGTPYGTAPYGIAIPKDSGLAQPVLAALKALMADGTYTKILDTRGIAAGAITTPVINGATS
jgi:polar amino acid transport system substrate-binding protein